MTRVWLCLLARPAVSLSTRMFVSREMSNSAVLCSVEKSEVLSFNLFTEEYPDMRKQDLLG